MSISMLITSSPEDLKKLKTAIDMLDLACNMSANATSVDINGNTLKPEDMTQAYEYFKNMYHILTTAGMTPEDYEETLGSYS